MSIANTSLINYLIILFNGICVEFNYFSDSAAIMIDVTSRLIVAFLDGVNIFDHSTPLNLQQKFAKSLVKLGNILEKLAGLIFPVHYKKSIATSIFSVINCWKSVVSFINHYAPEAMTEDVLLSIGQNIDELDQLISNINLETNIVSTQIVLMTFDKQNIYYFIFQNKSVIAWRLEKAKVDGNPYLVASIAPENIENCWPILLDNYSYTIPQLSWSQITSLARYILTDTKFSDDNLLISTRISDKVVQNHELLITALVFEVCIEIITHSKNPNSVTRQLLAIITKKSWEYQKLSKILKNSKKILIDPQWCDNDDEISTTVIKCLQIILHLPLIHLNGDLNIIIFLVIFAISKEWSNTKEIIDLCFRISCDVSENSQIDILQYIKPQYFIGDLLKNTALTKAVLCSLSNIENYHSLSEFIKTNQDTVDCVAPTLINSIEKMIKTKFKDDEKIIAQKIKKQLSKRMVKSLKNGIKEPYQVKSLTILVKAAVATKKIDPSLLQVVQSTITDIFKVSH